jgi:hypothetical protein
VAGDGNRIPNLLVGCNERDKYVRSGGRVTQLHVSIHTVSQHVVSGKYADIHKQYDDYLRSNDPKQKRFVGAQKLYLEEIKIFGRFASTFWRQFNYTARYKH